MGNFLYYGVRSSGVFNAGDGYVECDHQEITQTLSVEAVTALGVPVTQIKVFLAGNGADSYLVNSAVVRQGAVSVPVLVNGASSFYVPAFGRWSDYLPTTGFTLPGNVDFITTVSLKVPIMIPIVGGSGPVNRSPIGPAVTAAVGSVYTDPGTITDYFLGSGIVSPMIWQNDSVGSLNNRYEYSMPLNDTGCVALWDGKGSFEIRSYRFFTLEDDVEFTITLDLEHATAETAGYYTDYYFCFLDIEVRYENNYWDDHDYFEVNSYNPEYLALRDAILAANNTVTIKFSYSATTHILTITCNGDVSDATTIECYHHVQTTELSPVVVAADVSSLLPNYLTAIAKATDGSLMDYRDILVARGMYTLQQIADYDEAFPGYLENFVNKHNWIMQQYLPQIIMQSYQYDQLKGPVNVIDKITSIVTAKGATAVHTYFNGVNDRKEGISAYSKFNISVSDASLINNGDTIIISGATLGTIVYTLVDLLTGAANEILIGVTEEVTASNIATTIDNTFGELFTGTQKENVAEIVVYSPDLITCTASGSGISVGVILKTITYVSIPGYIPAFTGYSFSSEHGVLGDVYHLSTIPKITGDSTCSQPVFNIGSISLPTFNGMAKSFMTSCTVSSTDADKIALMLYGNDYMEWLAGLIAISGNNDDVALVTAQWVAKNITYTTDLLLYGAAEHWSDPRETLHYGAGDCEDFAFLLASLLLNNGVDPSRVRVYIGTANGVGHAWVGYRRQSDDKWINLDATKG